MRGLRYGLWLALLGAGQMAAIPWWPLTAWRPELLFLLAFHTGLHVRRIWIPVCFWTAGLARDVFLGAHLGASALLYLLAGLAVAEMRGRVLKEHLLTRVGMAFAAVFVIRLLRPLLEQRMVTGVFTGESLRLALMGALLTGVVSPLFRVLLAAPSLRTWSESNDPYGR